MNDEYDPLREPRLEVRHLTVDDIDAIRRLHHRCFPSIGSFTEQHLENHLALFAEGQIGVELDGELVATSSSLIVDAEEYGGWHSYDEVSGKDSLSTHDPEGDMLYGIDIAVDPAARGMRLSRRIYDARKRLCRARNLRGMLIAGRIPGYRPYAESMTPHEYVAKAITKEIEDAVIQAQLANGFVFQEVLPDYLPSDAESMGHAVLMQWTNPHYAPRGRTRAGRVRVAAVQYQMRSIESFEAFCTQCAFYLETAAEYRCDFLLFPELLTNQLLGLIERGRPGQVARKLDVYTERYIEFFNRMAIKYNVNVVAGSHLTVEDDTLYNIAYLFHRNGRIDKQYKLHITPAEKKWWGVQPGDSVEVFQTDRGKVAIAICYDVEFPEYARQAREQGARMLFVPFNTDLRSGYFRVRTCAAARCIENHMYAVIAGPVGNLPHVDGTDIHYAQAAILTPSDIQFSRDGICEEAQPGQDVMVMGELDLGLLRRTERTSTVRPWIDRRRDLYRVVWGEGDGQ